MKKLFLISALFVIPSVSGMATLCDYDSINLKVDKLLEEWDVNSNTFIRQDGCSTRMVILETSDDDDEQIAVGVFSIKEPSIFATCCGGTKKAYIEALAVHPSSRRKGAATNVINKIFKELQYTPDIEQVNTLVPRNNAAAEQFYKKMGFKEKPTPKWAPKMLTFYFSKKQN